MKDLLERLDPAFDHRNRLAIMALMALNERMDYNTLRQTLELTDGNLASHLKLLEQHNYIHVSKNFIGKKPQTTYAATAKGLGALEDHLNALELVLRLCREGLEE